ncbi:MAG TPA: ATP-binding protein [Steroidobacteraceae bacterium]|nr:ATP-binding protein [Steroidobacteraceae bacterium]
MSPPRNSGAGIAAEHLPTLLSDFVRIDTRVQKPLRSTGLGSSLARRFAHLLGGTVGVSSTEGGGSRFQVIIARHYNAGQPQG